MKSNRLYKIASFLAFVLLLCAGSTFSQGVHYHDIAMVNQSGFAKPLQSASISVCIFGSLGVPCSPTTTIYSDSLLVNVKSQPFLADVNGNFDFWAPSGNYIVTIVGAGLAGYSTAITLSPATNSVNVWTQPQTFSAAANLNAGGTLAGTFSGNRTDTGNNTHSATETFAGLLNCKNVENVRCVDDSNTQGWAGTDIGGWINSAYASCFVGTCKIIVYSATGNLINFSTPITFTTLSKLVNLECASPGNSTGTGGLVLNYTPTTATTAITIDDTANANVTWVPQEIRGCTLVNNQSFVQGGPVSSSATGIASGTINGGIGWLKLVNSSIIGFSNGLLLQNSVGGWGMDCDNSTIGDSTIGVSITANQEVFHMTKCRLMSNGRGIKSTAAGDIVVIQNQFDSNTVLAVDLSTATGGMFSSIGTHYENFNTTNCNYVQSVINNYFSGGTVLNDSTTSNCSWQFNLSGASSDTISGVAISTAGQTATNVFQINDPACSRFDIINNTPSVYTTLASVIGGSTTCNPVGTVIAKGAANQKNPAYFSTGAQGAPGIAFFSDPLTGWARVAAGAVQYVSAGSDGPLFTNVETRSGNLGRYTWSSAADALNGAADTSLSRDAAGVVDVGTGAQGSSAGTVKAALYLPTSAGGADLGTTALPFGNLWLGTAATNNFKFQPAATAGARVISMTDPLGNVGFPYFTGSVAAGNVAVWSNTAGVLKDGGAPPAGVFTAINVTPVTSSGGSTTNDQNLMAITVTAGTLNSVNKTILVQLAGVYSTPAASTTAVTHKLKLCTVSGCGSGTVLTLASWTSTALAGIQATNDPYNVTVNFTTQTAGASAAFESHGNLTIDISALTTAAEGVFADNNTATIGTIDSTAQLFLQHTIAFTVASASNLGTDRQMIVDSVD